MKTIKMTIGILTFIIQLGLFAYTFTLGEKLDKEKEEGEGV